MSSEVSSIPIYGDVSWSFKDIGHANPLAWSNHNELSRHNSCAIIPLTHCERMIIICGFVFKAKLCHCVCCEASSLCSLQSFVIMFVVKLRHCVCCETLSWHLLRSFIMVFVVKLHHRVQCEASSSVESYWQIYLFILYKSELINL